MVMEGDLAQVQQPPDSGQPWDVPKAAVLVDVEQGQDEPQNVQPEPESEQEHLESEAEQLVKLKKDEYRRLMGLQGGLSTLQQQYQGIKAENAQLRQEIEQLRALRQAIELQNLEKQQGEQVSRNAQAIKEALAARINLTDEEWEDAVAPIVQPLLSQLVQMNKDQEKMRERLAQAELNFRRAQGIEWLTNRLPEAIQEVQNEFAAIGASIELTPDDVRQVGATVESVRDFQHLKQFAREAAFAKARQGRSQGPGRPAPNHAPSPTWPSLPASGSVALSPATARRQYIEGKITFDQFREIMKRAPKEEQDLLPALF